MSSRYYGPNSANLRRQLLESHASQDAREVERRLYSAQRKNGRGFACLDGHTFSANDIEIPEKTSRIAAEGGWLTPLPVALLLAAAGHADSLARAVDEGAGISERSGGPNWT